MTAETHPHEDPLAEFGPNEWLVYEMYQQYTKDPASVDPAWWEFFADFTPANARPTGSAAVMADSAPQQDTVTIAVPPTPPSAPVTSTPPATPVVDSPAPTTAVGAPVAPAAGPAAAPPSTPGSDTPLRGAAARLIGNMEASLTVPTATSVRTIPAKLLMDNRIIINNALARSRGGKVSFTHLIGYAVVRAVADMPEMNASFTEVDGRPAIHQPDHVNLGIAIDLVKADGSRSLVVPSVKATETMDFATFYTAYEDVVRRSRSNSLTLEDYAGTSISLTNPGTIGTVHSVPRLMAGQGAIVGVGAMEYPAEYQGAAEETLARLAISKVLTLTSTYDHRVIQGAQSGEFLRRIHHLLLGEDEFYDQIFRSLRIPYEPARWVTDIPASHEDEVGKPARVLELIHAYRVRGHLMADTNPLEFEMRRHPDLDIVNYGLGIWDLDREFPTGGFGGKPIMKVRDILGVLRDSYCRTVGVEYMHIQDPDQRRWIQSKVELEHQRVDPVEQLRILGLLNRAEAFETFLQTKYVGQKRFSLEGGETLIPILDAILDAAAHDDMDSVVLGMAHRGRLNVLANIVGKSTAQIFREFQGEIDPGSAHGSGDVKYHLGADGLFTATDGATIPVALASNPSHLEAVDPVVEGIARARQDIIDRGPSGFTVLPVLVHGDAAFAGQGIVAETLNLSQLRGYRTGGTVHVVVNNQLGYTTSPTASRSSVYATDVARMIQAPIFHVNGDDPEACVRVARLAYEFRQAFRKDVVIDMICYRRRGHSEVDEPSFTQPLMYDLIEAKRSVRKLYTEALIGRRDITVDQAQEALQDYQNRLEKVFTETRDGDDDDIALSPLPAPPLPALSSVPTAVDRSSLERLSAAMVSVPEGFTVHPRLAPQLAKRASMLADDAVDWATAELLAIGTLLTDGRAVRLAGQDTRRGTFGQRHATLIDRVTGQEWTPLARLGAGAAPFYIYDSMLSEFSAVGFEYGYSVARPDALVMWEAQFGDFANGAQSIMDEFVSSGESKWGQESGLVMLLPHGYEGQGPDHSSARIERYLSLCAEYNMRVVMPTLPANHFHLLRAQALGNPKRPLIVAAPKSLLRHKHAISPAADFSNGSFRPVIADTFADPAAVRRILLASGKVCFDLEAERERTGRRDVAIVRIEQLYPLPGAELAQAIAGFPATADVVWVQEEPANMGPWPFVAMHAAELVGARPLHCVSRPAAASPASGSALIHAAEQKAVVEAAVGG